MKHFSTNPEYVETNFKRSLGETGLTKVFASMFNIWESILGLLCWEIKCREEGAIWLHWMLQNIIIILALDSEWSNKMNFFFRIIFSHAPHLKILWRILWIQDWRRFTLDLKTFFSLIFFVLHSIYNHIFIHREFTAAKSCLKEAVDQHCQFDAEAAEILQPAFDGYNPFCIVSSEEEGEISS